MNAGKREIEAPEPGTSGGAESEEGQAGTVGGDRPPTVQEWARAYLLADTFEDKLRPDPPPSSWDDECEPLLHGVPGRGPVFIIKEKTRRSIGRQELRLVAKRAELFHTFLHHELQAAELMCWALLSFPETPREFQQGLIGICQDEIRHMGLYASYLEGIGYCAGDFPVRDWFWQRVGTCETPLQFVALMGMGLEGGNLDHTLRYADWFRAMGDEKAAQIQDVICREEIPHVRFAIHWFRTWTGGLDFERWRSELVAPLSPTILQGKELHRVARLESGFDETFLKELAGWRNG